MRSLPSGLLALPAEHDARLASLSRKLRLLALRTLLTRPLDGLSEPVRRALPRLTSALLAASRKNGARVAAAIGDPDVLPRLLALEAGVADPDSMLRLAVPALLAALARARGTLEESVLWDVPVTELPDPERTRLLRFSPPARGVLADPSGLEVRLADGTRLPLSRVEHGAVPSFIPLRGHRAHLALHDANPLSMFEEHPDKEGNALSLGGRDSSEWTRALEDALALVGLALPHLHAELELTLERIVPVGYEPEKHLSASYREAPGLVYLTLHPSTLTMAEAIVHETQHGKLNVLSWFDAVLVNGRTEWTASPVRPDLRPLMGVLLAAHAFVPVAALHARLAELDHPIARTPEFARRRAEVLESNARGLATVHEKGDPTPLGRELIAALDALDAALRPSH